MIAPDFGPKFSLGQIVITANAQARLPMHDVDTALRRHLRGDWGELDAHDVQENQRSLQDSCRLLSSYRARDGTPFWIITEASRDYTTVLLPEDY